MRLGRRRLGLRGRAVARTSWKRTVRRALRLKGPAGWGLRGGRRANAGRSVGRTLGYLALAVIVLGLLSWLF